MDNQTNNQGLSGVFIGLGVLLIVLGALFFVGQAAGFALGRVGWPFFVISPESRSPGSASWRVILPASLKEASKRAHEVYAKFREE